jgi:uncharacterized membrane protein (Fun14 family)
MHLISFNALSNVYLKDTKHKNNAFSNRNGEVETMSAITPLVYQLGLGGIGGFIAGYALKKMMKLAAIIIGLFILALVYLGYQGIITIDYSALGDSKKCTWTDRRSSRFHNTNHCSPAIRWLLRTRLLLRTKNGLSHTQHLHTQ